MEYFHRGTRSYLIILSLFFCSTAWAISAPPPLGELPVSLQSYLKQLYDNFNTLEVVTTNPDGSRSGTKGEMLLLQAGGSSYLEINSDGSTTWLGVLLSNTP